MTDITAEEFVAGSWEIKPKLMLIRKGGKAEHMLGDLSRDCYDTELIVVSREDEENWIGYYAEGLGFFNVKFAKADCRDTTIEEAKQWSKDPESVSF